MQNERVLSADIIPDHFVPDNFTTLEQYEETFSKINVDEKEKNLIQEFLRFLKLIVEYVKKYFVYNDKIYTTISESGDIGELVLSSSFSESNQANKEVLKCIEEEISKKTQRFEKYFTKEAQDALFASAIGSNPFIIIIGDADSGKRTILRNILQEDIKMEDTFEYSCFHLIRDTYCTIASLRSQKNEIYNVEYIKKMKNELKKLSASSKQTPIIWYIIRCGSVVYQMDIDIATEVLKEYPVILIFNHSDVVKESIDDLIEQLKEGESNVRGIFKTCANVNLKLRKVTFCSKCGNHELIMFVQDGVVRCETCGHRESIKIEHNLDQVALHTYNLLSDEIGKRSFLIKQISNLKMKVNEAKSIIKRTVNEKSSSFEEHVMKMIARLSRLYGVYTIQAFMEKLGIQLVEFLDNFFENVKNCKEEEDWSLMVATIGIIVVKTLSRTIDKNFNFENVENWMNRIKEKGLDNVLDATIL